MLLIHKTHSKNDLIDIINSLNIPVVFSHVDKKGDLQDKIVEVLQNREHQKPFNIKTEYNIKTYTELRYYLQNKSPKKVLTVKEKAYVMVICKHIISYCNMGGKLELSNYYKDKQQIIDDMDYIKQYGDIPSVRRCCKLINEYQKPHEKYIPYISPQIQRKLNARVRTQTYISGKLIVNHGEHLITFD